MWRLFVVSVIFIAVVYAKTSESNGTFGDNIDGNELIELGRKFHKPVLTLIGIAIRNQQTTIQNQQKTIDKLKETMHEHPCGEWTSWSTCDATERGYFGSQTRTRSCVDTEKLDKKAMTTESDNKLCEGDESGELVSVCPTSYNQTSNGFCVKLNTSSVSNDLAAEQCKQEGGYLIHIDSQSKYKDFKSIVRGFTTNIHVNGRRTDITSPWKYQYGSKSSSLEWLSGYPRVNADYQCLVYQISSDALYNSKCSNARPFMCEILNV